MAGVIGLLTCEVLEEEVAYLLCRETAVSRIAVLASEYSESFRDFVAAYGGRVQVLETLDGFEPSDGLDVVVRVLKVALHMVKENLQAGVRDAAIELAEKVDVLMLGYGMCGNVLEDPEGLLTEVEVPIIVPRNDDGSIIDDCVCLVLGGTEAYLKQVYKEAGTWFLTPGWLRHWETLLVKELGAKDIPTVKWIFDRTGYKRALMVETGVGEPETYRLESEKFAQTFEFYLEGVEGSLYILQRELEDATTAVRERVSKRG
ncbi:MAG: DUF1638 domain-containing protein [Thermoleophilia bacterium]|nr:DUF1638 domain-containing protein [Thermoleophilia bacterium]